MINATMIYWVTFAILGCVTGHQILLRQSSYRTISKKTLDLLIIFFMPTYIFLIWMIKTSLSSLVLLQCSLVIIECLLLIFLSQMRSAKYNKLLISFLDDIALNLSVGLAFRESINALDEISEYKKQIDLREIIESFKYQYEVKESTHLMPEARYLLGELKKIDSSNFNVKLKTEALRNRLKSEQLTLSRVKVATSQARAQTGVCIFLYLGLILYTANSRSSFFSSLWFTFSVGLFLCGLALMSYLSRSAIKVDL